MHCLTSLVIFVLVESGVPATAASFDCGKASTAQEKAICADSKLSQLDEDTAAAYSRLRAQLTSAGAAKVQQDQREWLAWLRQTCPDRNDAQRLRLCLNEAYSTRFYLLRSGLKRTGGITFFPRLKVVTTPDKEERRSPSDPGFGIGWFSWPEIDQPTPRQASWNTAVRKQAISMTLDPDDKRRQPADFEPSSVADADVTIVYRLRAANEQFISVGLENGSYRHGMPHPNVETTSFEWWLERGRALKAEDVFRAGSGWEAFLGRRCYQKLTAGDHTDDPIERQSVVEAVTQVSSWTLDARKFKVTFGEYTVAPRSAGLESVELDWDELKPYLASTFDPARLPEPAAAHTP